MNSFTITPHGSFSLRASIRFLKGFTPARYRGEATTPDDRLRLAFPVEGTWQTAGVLVTQDHEDGAVHGCTDDPEPDGLRQQVARILSLDVDGGEFDDVRRRDPIVDSMAQRYPGLRPVCFYSPYEAACWAIIGHRIRIVQAASIKESIANRYGTIHSVGGVELTSFPSPRVLLEIADELRLPTVKIERLRKIADAALDGALDGARLRAMETATALEDLQRLDGIGPFSAQLILVRGAGAPDVFPTNERRLHDEMARIYRLQDAHPDQIAEIAACWAPYRSWVSLLIRTYREDTTAEIAGGTPQKRHTAEGPTK